MWFRKVVPHSFIPSLLDKIWIHIFQTPHNVRSAPPGVRCSRSPCTHNVGPLLQVHLNVMTTLLVHPFALHRLPFPLLTDCSSDHGSLWPGTQHSMTRSLPVARAAMAGSADASPVAPAKKIDQRDSLSGTDMRVDQVDRKVGGRASQVERLCNLKSFPVAGSQLERRKKL